MVVMKRGWRAYLTVVFFLQVGMTYQIAKQQHDEFPPADVMLGLFLKNQELQAIGALALILVNGAVWLWEKGYVRAYLDSCLSVYGWYRRGGQWRKEEHFDGAFCYYTRYMREPTSGQRDSGAARNDRTAQNTRK